MFYISIGLFVGILIESLNWTRHIAKLAAPIARFGRLRDVTAASFSMAFFSGFTANNMLAEAYDKKELTDRELIFSNLFNSFPTFCIHLPSLWGVIFGYFSGFKTVAFLYVGLSATAALLRTTGIVLAGHFLLPPLEDGCVPCQLDEAENKRKKVSPLESALKRFRKRLPKIVYITAPLYTLVFFAKKLGFFHWVETNLGDSLQFIDLLPAESLGVVAIYLLGEIHGGLTAAASLLAEGVLQPSQVVFALLVANVLSSPMRAFRHQFPYYAGIFKPKMAFKLILFNQSLRATSLALMAALYALCV